MDFLNLPNWVVRDHKTSEYDYLVLAEYTAPVTFCINCGCFTALKRHGRQIHTFMDVPAHGKRVGIAVDRQRFKCEECGSTFFQPLPDIHEKRLMTRRLVGFIQKRCLKRTFVDVSDEVGVDERTIRNIFKEYAAALEKDRRIWTPEWLGIDEVKIGEHARGVISDVGSRCLLEMLARRTQPAVSKFISRLDRPKVKLVCMDMTKAYKVIVQELLPKSTIVVDKFHVVRMANDALNSFRIGFRDNLPDKQRKQLKRDRYILLRRKHTLTHQDHFILDAWLTKYPTLKVAYDLKESFFDIWESPDPAEARKLYQDWKQSIPDEMEGAFDALTTAVGNWDNEIFAYFDHRATNAYTEALNGLAKLINREGRGYTFEVIRVKMLYGPGMNVVHAPRFGFDFDACYEMADSKDLLWSPTSELEHEFYAGSDISTLQEEIIDGLFRPDSTVESE